MTESEWLASVDPRPMLDHLRKWDAPVVGDPSQDRPRASARKLRLFACACCRQVWDGAACERCKGEGVVWDNDPRNGFFETYRMECPRCHGAGRIGGLTDPRSRRAVEVAERYADGLATEVELSQAQWNAVSITGPSSACSLPLQLGLFQMRADPDMDATRQGALLPSPAVQASLLRDVFTPFRPVSLMKEIAIYALPPEQAEILGPTVTVSSNSWLAWNDGCVPKLAQAIYGGWSLCQECKGTGRYDPNVPVGSDPEMQRCDFCHGGKVDAPFDSSRMPLLADALEEAGCEDAAILGHCRGSETIRCPYGCLAVHGKTGTWLHEAAGPDSRWVRCDGPCGGTGRVVVSGPHVRGCWVIDLLLGKE